MEGLVQCSANYIPLSPITFLRRAAFVYGDKVSIVYGNTRFSWRETHQRCRRLASALSRMGISRGDVVAAFAPSIPAMYELHFGVPMAGGILSALNTKLDPPTLAILLQELEAKAIFVDYQFVELVLQALNLLSQAKFNQPFLVIIPECGQGIASSNPEELPIDSLDYDKLLSMGQDDFEIVHPRDECEPISVNYTSGSTGRPKGAVYSHRATYLNSLAEIYRFNMRPMPVFLWTVDMFRCNGWCFPWAVAALGGTNVCIRTVTAEVIFHSIYLHKVTHFCGPPLILNVIAEAPSANHHQPLRNAVEVTVAGPLPPLETLTKVKELGFKIFHAYGMTEALGPVTIRSLDFVGDVSISPSSNHIHAVIDCQEGIHNLMMEEVDVRDPTTMESVPPDGKTIGEVMFRSNTLMSGYLKNPQATQHALGTGWYRTGDLGVRHMDGSIQMKDRVLDLILDSGGESISTLEVEAVLARHSEVAAAAVVGRPSDGGLGETPCAFVRLREGCSASVKEIVEFCGDRLPKYMVPRSVVFGDLPVNSTGKVQKFVLREKTKTMDGLSNSYGCQFSEPRHE